jgi:glutaminyl-peptide cyclotransferase
MGSSISFKRLLMFSAVMLVLIASCSEEPKEKTPIQTLPPESKLTLKPRPAFDADSAYAFIEKQVRFGPRVPNTKEHTRCASWLEKKLKSYGATVIIQKAQLTAYNGQELSAVNIMGQINPNASKRILLCAHWDSRPYADRDSKERMKPIDGANDGASGVGVLLEVLRAIHLDSIDPDLGVDIVFFDAEDYGKPEGSMLGNSGDSWCLGSQYWAKNLPIKDYKPEFGILLDMVGAADAVFPKEGVSLYYAPQIVDKVWKIAGAMGHENYFRSFKGNEITDDHRYLNEIAKIPTIDIIHYDMGRFDFGEFHHTHADNMDVIDKSTLQVVGDVVLQVLYQE